MALKMASHSLTNKHSLHSQLYQCQLLFINNITQSFNWNNINSRSDWSQSADENHPRSSVRCTASQIDPSVSSRGEGGCLPLLTEAASLLTENLEQTQLHFWNKSELAAARAEVSALSGAVSGKEFQLGERRYSDGWMIPSSVCNPSPCVPSPVPMRIRECVRPPTQLHIHSESISPRLSLILTSRVSVFLYAGYSLAVWMKRKQANKRRLDHNTKE